MKRKQRKKKTKYKTYNTHIQQKTEVFFAENSWEKIGSSTFLLGADQRLSGEGVFKGIYYSGPRPPAYPCA